MSSKAARNLLRRHYDSYGGYSMMTTDDDHQQENQEKDEQEQELAGTSSSRRAAEADDSWLQLGIGSSCSSSATPAISPSVELELFSDKPPSSSRPTMFSSSPPLPPPQQLNICGYRPASPSWGFTSNYFMNMQQVGGTSTSIGTSTSLMNSPQLFNYNVQRFSILPPPPTRPMRVVRMPARSGVWFILKAADNQVREPYLPQISKSYLRIKDGRMTVRLLMKYLVNKLGLVDESEVQILCRGQVLPPFLTLQHVRDSIWCLSNAVTLHPDSPSIDHIMTLQYSRSS